MVICLCKTDWLEYKSFLNGNEYTYKFDEINELYMVYNENLDGYWFSKSDMEDWFIIY